MTFVSKNSFFLILWKIFAIEMPFVALKMCGGEWMILWTEQVCALYHLNDDGENEALFFPEHNEKSFKWDVDDLM